MAAEVGDAAEAVRSGRAGGEENESELPEDAAGIVQARLSQEGATVAGALTVVVLAQCPWAPDEEAASAGRAGKGWIGEGRCWPGESIGA